MKEMNQSPMMTKERIEDTFSYKMLDEFKNEAGDKKESLDDYYNRMMKKYDLKKDENGEDKKQSNFEQPE